MADASRTVPENVAGDFFVDTTCIDCDTCRQIAPATFADQGEYSYVHAQPAAEGDVRSALHALLACPTGSIGTLAKNAAGEAARDFPLPIEGGVSYCGFTSESSFGASSYLVERPGGNWLVDAPRYTGRIVQAIEERGGLAFVFLTHRDDVADAGRYAERFGARRIIHRSDLDAAPDAEIVIDGNEAVEFEPGFVVVPTPGHTRGHCVLHVEQRFLFTGDHLWWSRAQGGLGASRSACWYSWSEQIRSMEKLVDLRFEWVLPGHGERRKLDPATTRAALERLVARMRA
jgi:glyoxylase-like metal-dependent hydrolase (beta-lactamase superfamily II)/ferredoxin